MFYQYKCEIHGLFEIKRPMAESSMPGECPNCGKECKRVFNPINWVWGLGGWDFDNEGMGDEPILRHND